MTQTSFDTLTTTRLLQEAGITDSQAEAITFAIKSGLEGELATKIDILNLESKLTQSIAETKIDIFNLESKLTQSIAETNRNVAAVKHQLDKHDERFVMIDKQFVMIDDRFDKMDDRFDKMDERFDKMDERFDKMDDRFDRMDVRFDKMDERLTKQEILLASFKNNFKWMYAFGSAILVILIMLVIPVVMEVFAL